MNERKIQMRLEKLRKADPKILIDVLELLLKSSLGRFIDILIFGDITPLDIPVDENEEFINTLSAIGIATLQAQEDLIEESEILSLEQSDLLKAAEQGKPVNRINLDANHQLGEMQRAEMEFLKILLRLEIDFVCGTATIGRKDEDIGIRKGFQITILKHPEGKVVPFPAQP